MKTKITDKYTQTHSTLTELARCIKEELILTENGNNKCRSRI